MQAETAAGRGSERRTRRVRGAGAAEPVMSKLEENTLNPNGGEFTSLRLLHCAFSQTPVFAAVAQCFLIEREVFSVPRHRGCINTVWMAVVRGEIQVLLSM